MVELASFCALIRLENVSVKALNFRLVIFNLTSGAFHSSSSFVSPSASFPSKARLPWYLSLSSSNAFPVDNSWRRSMGLCFSLSEGGVEPSSPAIVVQSLSIPQERSATPHQRTQPSIHLPNLGVWPGHGLCLSRWIYTKSQRFLYLGMAASMSNLTNFGTGMKA